MKNILIFGDSYSTYEGYIPEGYRTYYSPQGRTEGPAVTKIQVEETWWKRVVDLTGCNLLLNNSWSGSTIGYTGYEGDCSKSSSFIYRFRKLKEEGFFEKNVVDTVFVFGGTNDDWSGGIAWRNETFRLGRKRLVFCSVRNMSFYEYIKKGIAQSRDLFFD